MNDNRYCFYCSTTRGFLLSTSADFNKINSVSPEEPSETTALTFIQNTDEILAGYANGKVHIYNPLENKFTQKLNKLQGEGKIVGLESVDENVIAAKYDGIINIWNKNKNNYFDINLEERSTLECAVYNYYRENTIGTGGEHNDLKLWDLETNQCVFKAKSLGHDSLNLPIPTTVKGIVFFPDNLHFSACCTKEGHVLLYDDRAQRRPVVKFLEKKASYTAIACAYRERQCLVGTTRGYMQLLDMKTGKCLKTFTAFTGSITSIVCDPLEPFVATTSLDRYLRVHNLETKELLHKAYLKQSLTRLLMKPVVKDEPEENEKVGETVDEEYENIFASMETITDKGKKKRKSKGDQLGDVKKKKKSKINIVN